MRERPIGTGPFKLAQFSEFQYIRLVRNPDYWKKGKPYLDGIDFNIVSNPSTAVLSFVAGRFDLTFPFEVTPKDRKLIKKDAPQAICETTSMNLNLNLLDNRTVAPFDNTDIRRALVLAIDRKAFVETISQGDYVIGGTMQPPPDGIWGLSPGTLSVVPGYGPDVEKNRAEARALMEKAGYGPDKRLKVKLTTRASRSTRIRPSCCRASFGTSTSTPISKSSRRRCGSTGSAARNTRSASMRPATASTTPTRPSSRTSPARRRATTPATAIRRSRS
jgi:peptide/nickel transport system substrate-binding protein